MPYNPRNPNGHRPLIRTLASVFPATYDLARYVLPMTIKVLVHDGVEKLNTALIREVCLPKHVYDGCSQAMIEFPANVEFWT